MFSLPGFRRCQEEKYRPVVPRVCVTRDVKAVTRPGVCLGRRIGSRCVSEWKVLRRWVYRQFLRGLNRGQPGMYASIAEAEEALQFRLKQK